MQQGVSNLKQKNQQFIIDSIRRSRWIGSTIPHPKPFQALKSKRISSERQCRSFTTIIETTKHGARIVFPNNCCEIREAIIMVSVNGMKSKQETSFGGRFIYTFRIHHRKPIVTQSHINLLPAFRIQRFHFVPRFGDAVTFVTRIS